MQNIFKRLSSVFSAKQLKNYIKVTIPIVIKTSGTLLELRVKPIEQGYSIVCPNNIFLEANNQGDQEFYFNIFEKHDESYHYDINIKNGLFCKDYSNETNIVVAINEFIRFFILIDDFIIDNGVIGQEEKFI